jgi:polyisoprenoid-binding protein YceI
MVRRSIQMACVAAFASILTSAVAFGQDTFRVSGGEVTVVCPLTVGGSFEAKTKKVSGEVGSAPDASGAVPGAVKVDLQTLETGIGVRDRHMRDKYLEVNKGPEFAVATIEGIKIDKKEGKTSFNGTLLLHGQRKEISGTAEVKEQSGRIRVQAEFPLSVSQFAIPQPTYLGVGVTAQIQVKVTMTAEPAPTQTSGRR